MVHDEDTDLADNDQDDDGYANDTSMNWYIYIYNMWLRKIVPQKWKRNAMNALEGQLLETQRVKLAKRACPIATVEVSPPTSSWGMLIFQTCPNHFSGVIVTLWFPQTYSAPELAASCQPHSFIQNTLIQKSLVTSGSPGPPFKTPNRR